ncbi:MAG: class I SAM-dependent methyltransferase [Microscillaceae bacterium]|nr:class I SAM-dependent methyltransferase [Microscillaceae bacterium]MDW8460475.1 class I SAM-dependent methyltransferase [Cytophagales bacterium]
MDKILKDLNEFYKTQISNFEENAQKVNWKNQHAQYIRFEQLAKLLPMDTSQSFILLDLGCGLGDLNHFLKQKGYQNHIYKGYDVSADMIQEAQKIYGTTTQQTFELIEHPSQMPQADYCVASGIFNKKLHLSETEWLCYILPTLEVMHQKTYKGFAFNMLTNYADADKMRTDLYYANPCFFFDYCKRNFSRNVALLHDYQEYDFTILVRK